MRAIRYRIQGKESKNTNSSEERKRPVLWGQSESSNVSGEGEFDACASS